MRRIGYFVVFLVVNGALLWGYSEIDEYHPFGGDTASCCYMCDDPMEYFPLNDWYRGPYWFAFPRGPLWKYGLANPRRIALSAGWRFDDCNFDNHLAPVSFGDYAGLVRWVRPWCWPGVLQFGVEGAVWAFFEHTQYSAPLVNADYYVGFPLTYMMNECWTFRLRGYHISSHIGDEFLENHPDFERLNKSSEYIDLFASYQMTCRLRLYGGIGWIFRSDEEFKMRKFYMEYGLDYYFPFGNFYLCRSRVLLRPFFGAHFRNWADNDYNYDGTLVLGYEWAKVCSYQRKLRLFGEWHNGQSFEGQFSRWNTNYYSVTLAYAY